MGPERALQRLSDFLLLLEASFFQWRAPSFLDLLWKPPNRGFEPEASGSLSLLLDHYATKPLENMWGGYLGPYRYWVS